MRIQPGSKIAGFRAVKVRDALGRSLCNATLGPILSQKTLDWRFEELDSNQSVEELFRELVRLGYIERASEKQLERMGFRVEWVLTKLGRRFLVAKATAPLSRKKADTMLAKLLGRAVSINANAKYLYRVEKLAVFGSYLRPDVAALGDLDIAYDLVRHYEWEEYKALKRKREHEENIDISGLQREFGWPEDEVRKALKARTLGLSLHSWHDLKVTGGQFRIVFPTQCDSGARDQ